jgi:peptidoglycan/xylan/chitin deacetylase (PgdA/CDA1 family)
LYTHRIPNFVKWHYAEFYWQQPTEEKVLYLTFDDGPTPDATEFVLEELSKWEAKSTFFCLGKNIAKDKSILSKIEDQGHTIGNHSFSHLSGWESDIDTYLTDIKKCDDLLNKTLTKNSDLFRPPFGRINKNQISELNKKYRIILWDYLIGDFDSSLSKYRCFERAKKNIKNGDVIVLHDNFKSFETLQYVLPRLLAHFSNVGYRFDAL